MTADPVVAHTQSSHHRAAILASTTCGCFHCLRTFAPERIDEWVDDGQTALCPHCGIDAVVGDSTVVLTPPLLEAMQEHWFSP